MELKLEHDIKDYEETIKAVEAFQGDFSKKDKENAIKFILDNETNNQFKKLSFSIYGQPKAWQRHRKAASGHMYDPSGKDKVSLVTILRENLPENFTLIEGEIIVIAECYKLYPKSTPKYKAILCELGYIQPISVPDIDNYEKIIQDAFNKILYRDDSQIVDIGVSKRFSITPRIDFQIYYRQK